MYLLRHKQRNVVLIIQHDDDRKILDDLCKNIPNRLKARYMYGKRNKMDAKPLDHRLSTKKHLILRRKPVANIVRTMFLRDCTELSENISKK